MTGAKQMSTGEELQAIAVYQKTRDGSLAESVLKSRASWVQSIIANIPMPSFADMDTVFSDVMLAVYESLSNYDESKAALSTYLWRVIYNSALTSAKEQDTNAEQFTPELIVDEAVDYSECIENARKVILNTPPEMLNERSRKVAHMMLKGYSVQEIASTLDVTKSVAGEIITSIRRYIAWCMVKQNLSAEPVISDSDLMDLAEEHERANVTKWR